MSGWVIGAAIVLVGSVFGLEGISCIGGGSFQPDPLEVGGMPGAICTPGLLVAIWPPCVPLTDGGADAIC